MKKLYSLLFILMLAACKEDEVTCFLASALNSDGEVFNYTFQGTVLTDAQVQVSKSQILDYHYEYDNNGMLIKELMQEQGGPNKIHDYYEYEPTSVHITEYVIEGTDTLSKNEFHPFFVATPTNKIYHDQYGNYSYKFSDGNLIEYGNYVVVGTDTTATFTQSYIYDDKPNFFKKQEYRVAIPEDFFWAKLNSKNNLTKAIGSGFERTFTYEADDKNNLKSYAASTGSVVQFGYACQ